MQPSDVKLEEFSNCPGTDRVKHYLYTHNLNPYLEIVDLDRAYAYTNDRDTLVISILPGPTATQVALALGALAIEFNADEYNWEVKDGHYVVRIWWD